MPNSTITLLLVLFIALTALALLVQAIVLLAVFLAGKKALKSLRSEFEELRESASPLLKISKDFLDQAGPNIGPLTSDVIQTTANLKTVTGDMATVTTKLRVQVDSVQTSAAEILDRVKHQAERVDTMMTNLLDIADQAAGALHTAVSVPARQLAGVLAAAKAIVETLRRPEPPARRVQPTNDHETFI